MRVANGLADRCPGFRRCRMRGALNCWSTSPRRAESCLRAAAEAAVSEINLPPDLVRERDEIVQEVMLRAAREEGMRTLSRVRPSSGFLAWLRGVARNCARECLRRRIRARQARPRTSSLGPLAEEQLAQPGLSPLEWATIREEFANDRALLDDLPPPCGVIARLLFDGATHRDIAVFLQAWRPVGQWECRRLLRRTKAMLRAMEAGKDPRPVWRNAWNCERNPWFSLPPPPEKSLVG